MLLSEVLLVQDAPLAEWFERYRSENQGTMKAIVSALHRRFVNGAKVAAVLRDIGDMTSSGVHFDTQRRAAREFLRLVVVRLDLDTLSPQERDSLREKVEELRGQYEPSLGSEKTCMLDVAEELVASLFKH